MDTIRFVELVTVLPEGNELLRIYDDYTKSEYTKPFQNGLLVSSNLSEVLGANKGDTIRVKNLLIVDAVDAVDEVEMVGCVNQSYGLSCFMTMEKFVELYDSDEMYNTVLVKSDNIEGFQKELLNDESITSFVNVEDNYENHKDFLVAFKAMLKLFVTLALCLSLIIIFAVTIVNYTDKKYEYNTMQIIGYTPKDIVEMGRIENVVEFIVGGALGIPLAKGMKYIVTNVFRISAEIRMPREISLNAYIVGIVIILIAFLISNIAIRANLEKLVLTGALKNRV